MLRLLCIRDDRREEKREEKRRGENGREGEGMEDEELRGNEEEEDTIPGPSPSRRRPSNKGISFIEIWKINKICKTKKLTPLNKKRSF